MPSHNPTDPAPTLHAASAAAATPQPFGSGESRNITQHHDDAGDAPEQAPDAPHDAAEAAQPAEIAPLRDVPTSGGTQTPATPDAPAGEPQPTAEAERAARHAKALAGAAAFGGTTPAQLEAGLLAASQAFMDERMALSGVVASDFPIAPVPQPSSPPSFRITYPSADNSGVNHVTRHARTTDKYTSAPGIPGRPYWVTPPDEFRPSRFKALTEGEIKAVTAHRRLNLPTVGIRGCWGWTLGGSAEEKSLHPELHEAVNAGDTIIVMFDGDWSRNEQVAMALATLHMVLAEDCGAQNVIFPDFGYHPTTNERLGPDDWMQLHPGDDHNALLRRLMTLPRVPVTDLIIAKSWTLATLRRYSTQHIDMDDHGNGNLLVRLYGAANLKYIESDKAWVLWDAERRRWEYISSERAAGRLAPAVPRFYKRRATTLRERAQQVDERIAAMQAGTVAGGADAIKAAEAQAEDLRARAAASAKWGITASSASKAAAMLMFARSQPGILERRENFDAVGHVFAVANGILDLRDGSFREETQDDRILTRSNVRWDATTNGRPERTAYVRVRRFLREMSADSYTVQRDAAGVVVTRDIRYSVPRRRYLTQMLAEALDGSVRDRKFYILAGVGADGKSVLASLMQGALGGYAGACPPSVFLTSGRPDNPQAAAPFTMMVRGKRMIFMSETKDTSHLDEAGVKAATGGDRMAARPNYGDPTEFTLRLTPVLLTNALPKVTGQDKALWDRLVPLMLHCPHAREGVPANNRALPDADGTLKTWVETNADAHHAMLYVLLQAAAARRVRGVAPMPDEARDRVLEYRQESNSMLVWINDAGYVLDPYGRITLKVAYASHAGWSRDTGASVLSKATFKTRAAESLGVSYREGAQRVLWVYGLRERTDAETAATVQEGVYDGLRTKAVRAMAAAGALRDVRNPEAVNDAIDAWCREHMPELAGAAGSDAGESKA